MYRDHLFLESKESSFSILEKTWPLSFHSLIFQMPIKTYAIVFSFCSLSCSILHVPESPRVFPSHSLLYSGGLLRSTFKVSDALLLSLTCLICPVSFQCHDYISNF